MICVFNQFQWHYDYISRLLCTRIQLNWQRIYTIIDLYFCSLRRFVFRFDVPAVLTPTSIAITNKSIIVRSFIYNHFEYCWFCCFCTRDEMKRIYCRPTTHMPSILTCSTYSVGFYILWKFIQWLRCSYRHITKVIKPSRTPIYFFKKKKRSYAAK